MRLKLMLLMLLMLLINQSIYANSVNHKEETSSKKSFIELYLDKNLKVEDSTRFLLTKKMHDKLSRGLELQGKKAFDLEDDVTEEGMRALNKIFSEQSASTLKKLILSLGHSDYSNAMLVGPAGVGKSFVLNQLVAILSYGVVPNFLEQTFGENEKTSSLFLQALKQSYFKKTQIILVDYDLLSRDNTRSGQAYAKSEVRMRSLLIDLFNAAHEDFRASELRTVFVLEEVATLPELVQQTLKSLLDNTGFKSVSNDPLERGMETGYSVVGITTTEEYRAMVGRDSAVERRYDYISILEPTEQEALKILMTKQKDWLDRYNLNIGQDVLEYIVSMRSFFSNPPLSMPHSVLKVVDGLMLWASDPENKKSEDKAEISVEDAYKYLIEYSVLPKSLWLPEDGHPPLWNLAEKVKSHVIGNEKIIDQIIRRIKTGRTTGFRDFQVFIIMGASGSGKDTLADAINLEMFGHKGQHLKFDVGTNQKNGLVPILDGGSLGTSGERALPQLLTAFNEGSPNGLIVLNEVKGLESSEFDRLKVLIETGVIRPKGWDSRSRPLGLNVLFLMGQYGEELIESKTSAEAEVIIDNLSEADRVEILMKGEAGGARGAIPYAVIQRAIRSGGIFFLPPLKENRYIDILKLNIKPVLKNLKMKSQLNVSVDESLLEFVANLSIVNKRGTRGLDGVLSDLTETAISEAVDRGLPARGIQILITMSEDNQEILLKHKKGVSVVRTYSFKVMDLLRFKPTSMPVVPVVPEKNLCRLLF